MTETPDSEAPPTGPEVIRSYLGVIDGSPGVYRMLDAQSRVLYVGKARNLRARVSSYARLSGHSERIVRMIRRTASMMFLTTSTEAEALLLEQSLIKQLKPHYNVLLRDDKSFPDIVLTTAHDFPMIAKHRGARRRKGDYFGPFANGRAVNRALSQLQKAFLLRNCTDSVFESRTRPCLQYQIRRCSGPCAGLVSREEYAASVEEAKRYLSGKSADMQEELAVQMREASAAMEFERAAALRDRIKALTRIQTAHGLNPRKLEEADLIALHMQGGHACVQVFFIRATQNWGNSDFYPRIADGMEEAEVLEAFIGQFYGKREAPRQLVLSHPISDPRVMSEALGGRAGRKVEIVVPRRGEKAELIDGALRNARESLARRMADTATQAKLLEGLAEALGLDGPPARIEVYDNSHIQGANPVGAMIVAGAEGFERAQYRKFNIRSADIAPGDDFAMMREVLSRRFRRLIETDPDRQGDQWPDLVLIDGGAGQVGAAVEAMEEMGVGDVAVAGVSKGPERDRGNEAFHRRGRRPMALQRNDPVLYFVQRMRDEAHRFAIGAHRARRAKSAGASPLDGIPGVGPARKRALLGRFGSAKAVGRAALADLKAVDGVSEALARAIHDHFREAG